MLLNGRFCWGAQPGISDSNALGQHQTLESAALAALKHSHAACCVGCTITLDSGATEGMGTNR